MALTFEATRDVLADAWRAVEGARVPPDLQAAAFAAAVQLLAGGASSRRQTTTIRTGIGLSEERPGEGDGRIGAIAAKLGTAPEIVEEVVSDDGSGGLTVIVPPSRFEKAKSTATKQIALLVAASRQAAGMDPDWTSVEVVRTAVIEYGKYDGANFSTTISSMANHCGFRGKGQQKEMRVNRQGFEEAGNLIRRLSGSEA